MRTPPGQREKISAAAARRIMLAAQGFAKPRPTGISNRRAVQRIFDRVQVLQIDSVNVIARAHELTTFARIGNHERDALQQLAARGEIFEYWAHQASFVPSRLQPLFRWKMERATGGEAWGGLISMVKERPGYIEAVLDEVKDKGPVVAGELEDPGDKQGPWWGWRDGKRALEYLFWTGQVTARRRGNFEREYDIPERVLPPEVINAPTPSEDEARKELLMLAAQAFGVATERDLADYFMQKPVRARPLIAELVEDGRLVAVEVEGWKEPSYAHPDAKTPRRVDACSLIAPFDSLMWERSRALRTFGFDYKIEIYVPQPQRRYGYYVLPFVLGEHIVARVDLKADRKAKVLRAIASYAEDGHDRATIAEALHAELQAMAEWLGLDHGVDIGRQGDLSNALRASNRALKSSAQQKQR